MAFALLLLASCEPSSKNLRMGLFAGNNWGVPSGDSYRFIDNAIDAFQKENPGIEITYRSGTLKEDYSEWLAQQIVKGKEPDLFVIPAGDFSTYASIGVLEDLAPRMDRDPVMRPDRFYQTALLSGRVEASQFSIPLEVVPNLIFVNRTLLQRLGIREPGETWDWDQFYEICRLATRDSDGDGQLDQFGTQRLAWRPWSIANGGLPIGRDGRETWFSSDAFVQTIGFITQVESLNRKAEVPGFDSGRVAFSVDYFSGFRAYRYFPYRVSRFSQFEWMALPMPKGPRGKGASELQSYSMAISRRSNLKNEAWAFLRFLAGRVENQAALVAASYGWPVLKEAAGTDTVTKLLSRGLPGTERMADPLLMESIIEGAVVTPRFRKFDEMMALAEREIYPLIENPLTMEERLQKLDRTIRDAFH